MAKNGLENSKKGFTDTLDLTIRYKVPIPWVISAKIIIYDFMYYYLHNVRQCSNSNK